MPMIKLVISDLHLADGTSVLEGFGERQQAAFEDFLRATSTPGQLTDTSEQATEGESLSQGESVELIINGDCFDFLVTPPYDLHGVIDAATAVQKLEKIIAAHMPFFRALHDFINVSGRSVTFITGNHDIELRFAGVRERICQAITGTPADERVAFCAERFYRPLPDVYIEHGQHYDFWNHFMAGVWDEHGQPLTLNPDTITLPLGSHYFQHAAYPMSLAYPYFDRFYPPTNIARQIALLCLFNPPLIIEVVRRVTEMMSHPRTILANLKPGEEHNPRRLFEEVAPDFLAFQTDMQDQKKDWTRFGAGAHPFEEADVSAQAVQEFFMLRDALALSLAEAVGVIARPAVYQMGKSVAHGMRAVLHNDATLRYAIAGHTHAERIEVLEKTGQTYINPATWVTRLAPPTPDEIAGEHGQALLDWLRTPNWQHIPLRDVTQFNFVLITAEEDGSASARLCVM